MQYIQPTEGQDMSVKAQYDALVSYRNIYEERAEAAAEITIPHLFPQRGISQGTDFEQPYQSIGAQGLNGLSSKLLLALLPPNAPFFRLLIDDVKANQEGLDQGTREKLDNALSKLEREILKELESSGFRNTLHGALRQLVLAGNVLIHFTEENARVFKLRDYVVERDYKGNAVKVITVENVNVNTLDENVREFAKTKDPNKKDVEIFTYNALVDGKWKTYQELCGEVLEGSEGSWKKDEFPYLALRWAKIDGEHYARGYVEELIGDLNSAEGLSRAILEGAAAAARVIFLVDPNSQTNIRDLAETQNGGFASGNADAVQALQVGKQADLQVAMSALNTIKERLSQAFLSGASNVRNAERVTAAEIRMITQELESNLGGLYSILATDLQLPIVSIMLARLKKQGKVKEISKDLVKPAIVTGVDALGRGNDLQKLDELMSGGVQLFGEKAMTYINVDEYMTRRAKSLGIETENLIKSSEQLAEEQNQGMMQGMTEQAMPQIVGGIAQQQQ